MTWIATYGDIEQVNGRIRLFVDYTDGTKKVRREYDVTDKDKVSVRAIVREEIESFERQDSLSDIKPGESVDTATQEDSEKKAFLEDIKRLKQMNNAILLRIIKETDQDFLDLLDRVRSRFKEEYLNLL